MDENQVQDICRVCRSEATPEKPLYHPCICTGSIKFIHQECLLQWLNYSRKEYCELCSHRFSFMPIYSPDMPKRLPIKDILTGLLCSLGTAVRFWLHYTLVAVAWLGIVPLTACRIYRCLFTGSLSSIITLPFDILSTDNVLSDCLYGCCVVTCTLCAFISLVWLREQILHGGGPEWIEHDHDILHIIDPPDNPNNNHNQNPPAAPQPPVQPERPSAPTPDHPAHNEYSLPDSSSGHHHDHHYRRPSLPYNCPEHAPNECPSASHHDHHRRPSSPYPCPEHAPNECPGTPSSSSSSSEEDSDDERRRSPSPHSISVSLFTSTSFHHRHSSASDSLNQRRMLGTYSHSRSPSPPPGSLHNQYSSSPNIAHSSASSMSSGHSSLGLSSMPHSHSRNQSSPSSPSTLHSTANFYQQLPSDSDYPHPIHGPSPLVASNLGPPAGAAANTDNNPSDNDIEDELDVDANDANNGAEDINNWNPIEWDHAAEELTWERLLGLDGSLVFLEHVFWVVSLNTLFIVVFAFFPYHIGQFALTCFGFKEYVRAPEFEGLLTTLFGYINIGTCLALLHGGAALVRLNKTRRLLGLCYVVIKVSLLSVIEIGIFPLVCGWWLDVCSLTLLDATIHDREAGFKLAPGTSMFIHWLAGMVYVFYFASFILLLREVLRPGVLWFLKNLNDPDFNPIQEMIHSPILRHIRRVLISLVTFGSIILLVVWLPVRIIEKLSPNFLPYQVMLVNDMPYSELSLELVLLQVVLPALLEQGHMRNWIKFAVRSWCIGVSYILDIRSYLLGDVNLEEQADGSNAPAPAPANEGDAQEGFQAGALAAAHQALLQPVSPSMFQPYKRPKFLPFKIVCLIFFICISLSVSSLIMITVPVYIGRSVMALWLGNTKVHELYTLGCGMYICWLSLRISTLLWSWLPKGWASISKKLREVILIVGKLLCAMSMLLFIIPLLMGLTLDVLVTVPARVALNQTPIISLWQDWAIGVLLTKTFFAIVLVGPDWWLKRIIEQVYMGGIRNMNLKLIFMDLSLPIVITLGLSLSLPYIIACTFVPMFTKDFEVQNLVLRRIYPALLALCVMIEAVVFHIKQFFRLYEHIKNDKYLVGKRLVNYEHRKLPSVPSQPKVETSPVVS